MISNNLDISLFQGDTIYALYGQMGIIRGLEGHQASIMFNRIKLTNTSNKSLELKSCSISFTADGKLVQKSFYDTSWIESEAKQALGYVTNPMVKEYYKDVLYFQGQATASSKINPNESLFIFGQYFDIYAPQRIDDVEIACELDDNNIAKKVINIAEYKTKRDYIFPMKGKFVIVGGPRETWGHRTKHPEEFGIDVQILDENQRPYKDDPFKLENHYCVGADIIAPADGKIVFAEDGVIDNPIPYDLKNNGKIFKESSKEFPFIHAAGGNYIVIDHGNSEFSNLCHLQNGSIKVKKGDVVKQGQVIAKCGNSGEGSTAPHLHYHLMNNSVMAKGRGLPVTFTNVQGTVFRNKLMDKMGLPDPIRKIFSGVGFSLWETVETK